MTEEKRYAFENLILLCPTHHVVIDRLEPHIYTVEVLRGLKAKVETSAMSGEGRMIERLGVDYVELAATQFIVASNWYYSLPPLPTMPRRTTLHGTFGSAVNVEAKVDINFGGLDVEAR